MQWWTMLISNYEVNIVQLQLALHSTGISARSELHKINGPVEKIST